MLQAGCEQVEVTTVEVARVELDPLVATVGVEQSIRLSATVLSDGGQTLSGRRVEWSSLDPDIAVVDDDGTVTGLAPGLATIRAASEGALATASVTVNAGPVIGLTPASVEFIAVQNGASPGDRTVSISNAGGGTLSGLTTGIRYTAGPAGWLSASLSGTTAPAALVLSVNQGSLGPGTYTAQIDVASPGASNSPAVVTVTLTVAGPQPAIALGATAVSFAAPSGGANPAQQSIGVTNAGGGNLTGLSAAVDYTAGQPSGWLSASLTGTSAPTTLVLQPATGNLPAGTYTANVRIRSNVAQNSPQTVSVSFTVGAAEPTIGVSPGQLIFRAQAGGASPATQTVNIVNAGGGTLSGLTIAVTYPAGRPAGWITTSLNRTTAPATLTVSANIGSLQPGTYDATVQVSASGVSNSPQTVQVTFEVQEAPSLAAPAAPTAFTATGASTSRIDLTWSHDGLLLVTGFEIQRAPDGSGSFATIATPGATVRSHADSGLPPGTSFRYRIRACNAVGCSAWVAATASTQGDQAVPSTPTGVDATAISSTEVIVTWTPPGGQAHYEIRRRSGQGGQWTFTDIVAGDATSYLDTGLSRNSTYQYQIAACTSSCSDFSSPVTVRTTGEGTSDAIGASAIQSTDPLTQEGDAAAGARATETEVSRARVTSRDGVMAGRGG